MSAQIHDIPVVLVAPGPNVRTQMRGIDELAASIRAQGLLQPVTVQTRTGYPGQFTLVLGQRRLEACRRAGLKTIPAIVVSPADAGKLMARQLVENLQRDDMTPLEKSAAIRKLMRVHGWSQAQVASALGYSSGYVSQLLAMQDLDAATQQRVADGRVSVADATAAVREHRRSGQRGQQVTREAPWFTKHHPLAGAARALCQKAGGHPQRPKPAGGSRACGPCWQRAIENHAVTEAQLRAATPRPAAEQPPAADLAPVFTSPAVAGAA